MPRSNHGRAAHQTGSPGTPVDVDLSPMPVLPWDASDNDRIVFGTNGINPAAAHPITHQLDEIQPQRSPLLSAQFPTWQQRIKPVTEQQLSSVDVPDPGERRLIHEQRGQWSPGPGDAFPSSIRVGIRAQRVWSQPGTYRLDLGFSKQFAGRRST
jgi:hypothetical protein